MSDPFKTLSQCEFGTIWLVPDQERVVVNAHNAAMYFNLQDFMAFAEMVYEAAPKVESGEAFMAEPRFSEERPSNITVLRGGKKE